MGGAVALKVHLKEPLGWDGVILVAPMCKVSPSYYRTWSIVKVKSRVLLNYFVNL